MCFICDGKRDLRVVASVVTLLTAIDFERAKMVLMTRKVTADRIQEIIEETAPGEATAWLNLDDLLGAEDEDTGSFKSAMAMMAVLQDALDKVDMVYNTFGPFTVPPTEHESADAFNSFISEMFGGGGEEDQDHDEDES